jgi:hypothetical protein
LLQSTTEVAGAGTMDCKMFSRIYNVEQLMLVPRTTPDDANYLSHRVAPCLRSSRRHLDRWRPRFPSRASNGTSGSPTQNNKQNWYLLTIIVICSSNYAWYAFRLWFSARVPSYALCLPSAHLLMSLSMCASICSCSADSGSC